MVRAIEIEASIISKRHRARFFRSDVIRRAMSEHFDKRQPKR